MLFAVSLVFPVLTCCLLLQKKFDLPEGEKLEVLKTFTGDDLIGTKYNHPLNARTPSILAGGDYITTESGTGLVHTAPGHGQEDYQTGLKAGLELISPVDDVGKFTIEAGEEFVGLSVLGEGNQAIIDALQASGTLLKAEDYGHKYPYDWRTKKPTIFRATDQWFASVEGFRDNALKAVDEVRNDYCCWLVLVGKDDANEENFYPEGLTRLAAHAATIEIELFNTDASSSRWNQYNLC